MCRSVTFCGDFVGAMKSSRFLRYRSMMLQALEVEDCDHTLRELGNAWNHGSRIMSGFPFQFSRSRDRF